MPSFSPLYTYDLTATQVDLIIYTLNKVELNSIEDDERCKIIKALENNKRLSPNYDPLSEWISDEPICDI